MNETKTIRNRGRAVEVVTRTARRPRNPRPLFGSPESVIGERVQKGLDNALMYASLDALMVKKGE